MNTSFINKVKILVLIKWLQWFLLSYSLRFKTKDTYGEISLKLRQTNWNVARNNVNVVVDELPSQSTNNYTYVIIDI